MFLFLKPKVDFNAASPISESRAQVELRIEKLANALGFSLDSLEIMSELKQNTKYLDNLRDTLGSDISPKEISESGGHLKTWNTIVGIKVEADDIIQGANKLFDSNGLMKFRTGNNGQVIQVSENPKRANPTFLKGESLQDIAQNIVGSVLGYNLKNYEQIDSADESNQPLIDEGQTTNGGIENGETANSKSFELKWRSKAGSDKMPLLLSLKLEPFVKESGAAGNFRTEFGYKLNSFSARSEYESIDELSRNNETIETGDIISSIMMIIAMLFLGGMSFAIGIQNIFRGKVEWRRVLVVFVIVSIGLFIWSAIFYMESFVPFLGKTSILIVSVNSLFSSIAVGLYLAMAYVSWEALARSQNHPQVAIIDAVWQRRFFVRETGAGIMHGFGLGGLVIGVFALVVFATGGYYFQNDSQYGFSEASNSYKLLTLNLNAWTSTWLVVIVQIALVYSAFNQWIKKKSIAIVLSILISAVFVALLGRLQGTSGGFTNDYLIFLPISVITILAYRRYGILTVATGWWLFVVTLMVSTYWGSQSMEMAYVAWAQIVMILGYLNFGIIAYIYGTPIVDVGEYIPEYEERISQHLRVEKEIEIARESQYKLMPLQPPKADGFDVYGFFLPSFEVGGDYFDYVLSKDVEGNPKALTMVVVDVSGKAMRAAMPAIFTSGLLLAKMKDGEPAQIMSEVAEPIHARTDKRTFITCVIARYDLASERLSVANAGHCKPILKRNGKADFIQTPEPRWPLGLKAEVEYKSQEFKLKKGDFILLYSDGLPEAVNEKGQRFGFDEVPALVERIDTENLSAIEIAQEIKRTVTKFSNHQLVDDTTIICLKV